MHTEANRGEMTWYLGLRQGALGLHNWNVNFSSVSPEEAGWDLTVSPVRWGKGSERG